MKPKYKTFIICMILPAFLFLFACNVIGVERSKGTQEPTLTTALLYTDYSVLPENSMPLPSHEQSTLRATPLYEFVGILPIETAGERWMDWCENDNTKYEWDTCFYFRNSTYRCEGNGFDYLLVSDFNYDRNWSFLWSRYPLWLFDLGKFEATFAIDNGGLFYHMQGDADDTILLCAFEDRIDIFVRIDSNILNPTAYTFADFDSAIALEDTGNKYSEYFEKLWELHVSETPDNLGDMKTWIDEDGIISAYTLQLHIAKYPAISYRLGFIWDVNGWSLAQGSGQYGMVYNYPNRDIAQYKFKG